MSSDYWTTQYGTEVLSRAQEAMDVGQQSPDEILSYNNLTHEFDSLSTSGNPAVDRYDNFDYEGSRNSFSSSSRRHRMSKDTITYSLPPTIPDSPDPTTSTSPVKNSDPAENPEPTLDSPSQPNQMSSHARSRYPSTDITTATIDKGKATLNNSRLPTGLSDTNSDNAEASQTESQKLRQPVSGPVSAIQSSQGTSIVPIEGVYVSWDSFDHPDFWSEADNNLRFQLEQAVEHCFQFRRGSRRIHQYLLQITYAGLRKDKLRPSVVITTSDPKTRKILKKSLSKTYIKQILQDLGRDLWILLDSHELAARFDGSSPLEDPMIRLFIPSKSTSLCGSKIHVVAENVRISSCVFGGSVIIGDELFGLTVLHPLVQDNAEDEIGDLTETSDESDDDGDDGDDGPFFLSCDLNDSEGSRLPDEDDSDYDHALEKLRRTLELTSINTIAQQFPSLSDSTDHHHLRFEDFYVKHKGTYADWSAFDISTSRIFGVNDLTAYNKVGGHRITSIYKHAPGENIAVKIALPDGEVDGEMIAGSVTYRIGTETFDLRLVTVANPIPRGCSGAWVVHQTQLVGVVLVVRRVIPWVYILPFETVKRDIEWVTGRSVQLPNLDNRLEALIPSQPTLALENDPGNSEVLVQVQMESRATAAEHNSQTTVRKVANPRKLETERRKLETLKKAFPNLLGISYGSEYYKKRYQEIWLSSPSSKLRLIQVPLDSRPKILRRTKLLQRLFSASWGLRLQIANRSLDRPISYLYSPKRWRNGASKSFLKRDVHEIEQQSREVNLQELNLRDEVLKRYQARKEMLAVQETKQAGNDLETEEEAWQTEDDITRTEKEDSEEEWKHLRKESVHWTEGRKKQSGDAAYLEEERLDIMKEREALNKQREYLRNEYSLIQEDREQLVRLTDQLGRDREALEREKDELRKEREALRLERDRFAKDRQREDSERRAAATYKSKPPAVVVHNPGSKSYDERRSLDTSRTRWR